MISLSEIGKVLATAYEFFQITLVPLSIALFFAAGYIAFSGRRGKYLGYETHTHGNRLSLVITLIIGSISILAIDAILKGIYEFFMPNTNLGDLINFDNVANMDEGESPLKAGLNLAGYYFYLVSMGFLIKAFISGRPKAIWYSLIGSFMTMFAATSMVSYS